MLGDFGQAANELYGVTNNPWDATRTPGGSSDGNTTAYPTSGVGGEEWALVAPRLTPMMDKSRVDTFAIPLQRWSYRIGSHRSRAGAA